MDNGKYVELLAPAGNMEGFYGAVNAGADAVYLSGNRYGARAYAENFSDEDLLVCLRQAHLFHKKIYLTVNTLLKEQELSELPAFLDPLVGEGLDGVIVQDFGVLQLLKECFPGLPLHASTQMSVTGSNGAALLRRMGVVRIVPARELSMQEVRLLSENSGMEIECFIHGAMCYSYSGQCLFSSILGERSGNRGRCAQPCRLPYTIVSDRRVTEREKEKECYPISLKDLCTLEMLPELVGAGITSLKIEGRMKKAEYAAGVTAIYRKYLDRCLSGEDAAPSKEDLRDLRRLYVRGETGSGYYHCRNSRQMITLNSPAYSESDEELLEKIHERYLLERPKIPICMRGIFLAGQPAEVWIKTADKRNGTDEFLIVRGDPVETASQRPLTRENIYKQLSKLGESSFALRTGADGQKELDIQMGEEIFYPLKKLNELRRQAVAALEEVILHER